MLSFHKPKNAFLSKYIEGYYLKNDKLDFSFSYYTFPNNFQIITCALESEITLKKDNLISNYKENAEFIATLTYNYSKPIKIDYDGKVNELTIYFKPLGLCYFIKNIGDFYTDQNFISFFPFDDFQNEMTNILSKNSIEDSIESLEKYWMSHFSNLNLRKMEQIIDLLEIMNVQEVAEKLNISRQYIHKIFKLHLGKSPIEYRRIQRFRNSIDFPDSYTNQNLFYDQSHFIKETLRLTNKSPKKLLENIEYRTSNPWLLI